MEESFGLAIQEHLELQRRNRLLEAEMPIATYRDPSAATSASASAVLEETQEWALPELRGESGHQPLFPPAEELWSGTPAFDWGD
jgi:hypothetical protein